MKTATLEPIRARRGRPPREDAREATRRRILDAAQAAFSERGYHDTSVEDIVRGSGLSKGGFYFHFPSKEAVFSALYDEISDALYQRAAAAAAGETEVLDQLAAGVRAFIRGCYEMRSAKLVFAQPGGANPMLDRKREESMVRFGGLVQTSLDTAVAQGLIPPVNTAILARALVGAFSELGMEVVRSTHPDEVEEVADVLVDVICYMALSAAFARGARTANPTRGATR